MQTNKTNYIVRWSFLALLLLALIIIPFVLFEQDIDQALHTWLNEQHNPFLAPLIIASLLALDIFLPIPASVLGTASGVLFGAALGALVIWLGLSLGCLLAYVTGRHGGSLLIKRVVGEKSLQQSRRVADEYGGWAIVICRAVPVLAEASVIWAGSSKMKFQSYFMLTSLSNAGIALIYSNIGAWFSSEYSFYLAFAAGLIFPAIVMISLRRFIA